MFDSSTIIAGLEIGTSKVCAAVGELNADGALNIIGLGQAPSQGVRKGEIVCPQEAEECVRAAMVQAEQMANAELRSVFLGVTGGHLRGSTSRGIHPVVSADREIEQRDVDDVIKNAKSVNLPPDHHILHTLKQRFVVDGQAGVINPVGMLGARLEVDVHVVHGKTNRIQNTIRVVRGLQIDVEFPVFNGLASALAVLAPEQKETGALVIDLGGGTTDYVAYADGVIKHTGVLAVGGDHVSNDLAYGLRAPLGRAESLKIEHGAALPQDEARGQFITFGRDPSGAERSASKEQLQLIMAARVGEILQLVAEDIEAAGLLGYLGSGVVLCGGGARIPRVAEAAAQVFGAPVTLGKTNCVNGLRSALDHPEFATVIGLVCYGSLQHQRRKSAPGLVSAVKETFSSLFNRRG